MSKLLWCLRCGPRPWKWVSQEWLFTPPNPQKLHLGSSLFLAQHQAYSNLALIVSSTADFLFFLIDHSPMMSLVGQRLHSLGASGLNEPLVREEEWKPAVLLWDLSIPALNSETKLFLCSRNSAYQNSLCTKNKKTPGIRSHDGHVMVVWLVLSAVLWDNTKYTSVTSSDWTSGVIWLV